MKSNAQDSSYCFPIVNVKIVKLKQLLQHRQLYDITMMTLTALNLSCAQENIERFEAKSMPCSREVDGLDTANISSLSGLLDFGVIFVTAFSNSL